MTARQRIGILGGTFDPVHIGHLHIARCARHDLHLDEVVIIPAGSPPHKPRHPVAPGMSRLEMVDAAIKGLDGLRSSDIDLRGEVPSFTSGLLSRYSDHNPDADLWFIIGSDSLHEFPTWHRPDLILQYARLAVAERPEWPIINILDRVHLSGLQESVDVFTSVPIELSASTIRARLAEGLPVDWLVPPAVLELIDLMKIYRRSDQPDRP